jgi:uncharacterized protein YndB with AHSA1/START domain
MKSYHCQVEIAAPAAAVFKALTTEQGLKGWWATTCQVRTGIGSRSTFRFGKTHHVMRPEKFLPNREVACKCIEEHHESAELRRKDEWAGTKVKFRIEGGSPSSMLLRFEHEGLVPQLECYQICEQGWGHFLKQSL